MTKHATDEPYLPFLESNGWKTCTIIMLVYVENSQYSHGMDEILGKALLQI